MYSNLFTDICQIRLDFKPMVLSQPHNVAATLGSCGAGNTDALTMTPGAGNVDAGSIPVLCGTLTNQHGK